MQWKATYTDGSSLTQFSADRSERKYTDIDRSRLRSFALYDGERKLIELHLEPGQRLIYRRRVRQTLGQAPIAVYLVGFQETVNGRNMQCCLWLFEDGHIEVTGRYREDHGWFYSPQFYPQEG